MNLGSSIRTIRKARGMTATMLAHKVGCSQKQLSFIEKGRAIPQKKTLDEICKALSVSVGFLVLGAMEPSDFPNKACVKSAIEKLVQLL